MTRYVFYVNVGNMPSEKAEAYLKKVVDNATAQEFFAPTDKVLYIATKTRETSLETLYEPYRD